MGRPPHRYCHRVPGADSPRRLWGAFLGALAFLATIVGAYYGAAALNAAVGAFVFMIPAAILIALVRVYGKPATTTIRTWLTRIKKYESLLRSSAEAIARAEDLQREVDRLTHKQQDDMRAGILEGRRRAIAEVLGQSCRSILVPISVGVEEGNLLIGARIEQGQRPPAGSRLLLRVRTMPGAKAALTVLDGRGDEGDIVLGVDQMIDEDFVMGMMRNAAAGNPDPPASLLIVARDAESLHALMTEDWVD